MEQSCEIFLNLEKVVQEETFKEKVYGHMDEE